MGFNLVFKGLKVKLILELFNIFPFAHIIYSYKQYECKW